MSKIKRIVLSLLLFAIISIVMLSCDPGCQSNYIVFNNCNEQIEIQVYLKSTNNIRNFTVDKNTEYLFHTDGQIGDPIPPIQEFDSIIVKKENSIANINVLDLKYWEISKKVEFINRYYYYCLEINNEYFE